MCYQPSEDSTLDRIALIGALLLIAGVIGWAGVMAWRSFQ